jgi:hypothetical protein
MANRLESRLNDEFANREDKKGTNGIRENSRELVPIERCEAVIGHSKIPQSG